MLSCTCRKRKAADAKLAGSNMQTQAVTIKVVTGYWAYEMGFSISGTSISYPSGSFPSDNTTYTYTQNLAPGTYTINAVDSYGDGWNGGTVQILLGTQVLLAPVTLGGGSGGVVGTFTVPGAAAPAAGPSVTKIEVWSGALVDCTKWTMSDGSVKQYGSPGGSYQGALTLGAGEYVTAVTARNGDNCDAIQFVTNTGRTFGMYGNIYGGSPSTYTAPSGQAVVGLQTVGSYCPRVTGIITGAAPVSSPSCGIARGASVYNGCGYTYQKLANCQNQCQQFGGSCTPVPFIPAEGAYATASGGSCGITRGQSVYNGCGYVYQAQGNWQQQCGSGGNTTGFIPSE